MVGHSTGLRLNPSLIYEPALHLAVNNRRTANEWGIDPRDSHDYRELS